VTSELPLKVKVMESGITFKVEGRVKACREGSRSNGGPTFRTLHIAFEGPSILTDGSTVHGQGELDVVVPENLRELASALAPDTVVVINGRCFRVNHSYTELHAERIEVVSAPSEA
jgi:hypothetical protein